MKQTYSRSSLQNRPGSVAVHEQPTPGLFSAPLSPVELAQRLQTTLDLEQTLELFSRSIRGILPHDGFSYDHSGLGLRLRWGRRSRHSCSYNLLVEEQDIGELRFLRGKQFQEPELEQLENMLAGLVYPLRNALLYRQALQAAQTDPLTGLHNRAALDRLLPRELASFQRTGRPLAMLMADLDHFKAINDTLGHSTGDQVLKAVARCLEQATRKSDLLFRSGGEEFVVLLWVRSLGHGLQAGERIRAALEDCRNVRNLASEFPLTASIGLAFAREGDTPRSLFDRADSTMYSAKQAGRNQVRVAC